MRVATALVAAGALAYCGMFVWYLLRAWLFLRKQLYQKYRLTHQLLQMQVRPLLPAPRRLALCA